ncbi:SpoIIE family protein phosphatase [Ruegeria sp. AU67]|uniref:SpoIIE family protein phosphatase n=1 Tax=Ruegeria sp. AU67 TaxID=2108530 RepID=UPI000D688252|nr:SpoIIE family protein phosphatase [Ruegeria sp. AU67]
MRKLWTFLKRRIFLKHILATLLLGGVLNAIVLLFYYEFKKKAQTDQVAAEVATIANRIARPLAELVEVGNFAQATSLLAVYSGFPYIICAEQRLEPSSDSLVSWPAIGCDKIKKSGLDVVVSVPTAAGPATMLVRIDQEILNDELRTEVGVVVLLGMLGGFALILAGAAAFLWLINRPLGQMLKAIERFERYDDPQIVPYQSEDEIGKVVQSYNSMLDREVERVSEIREAHHQIVASVNYATRIQQGLLPRTSQCKAAFADFAVIWEPRDLVGGDIYWVKTDGPITTLAVIDCTGHGVPGGFMTMLAIATLERLYFENETLSPSLALSKLSDLTRSLLNQDTENGTSNDGMDAAICQIDSAKGVATFAGAHMSLLVKSKTGIDRIRGDKLSIGYADTPIGPKYLEHEVQMDQITDFFISTDGLIDQLGGEKRLAFGFQRIVSVFEQEEWSCSEYLLSAIHSAFQDYSTNEERLDDLTMIAFRTARNTD